MRFTGLHQYYIRDLSLVQVLSFLFLLYLINFYSMEVSYAMVVSVGLIKKRVLQVGASEIKGKIVWVNVENMNGKEKS